VQQIERDCFSVAKRRSIYIYTTLAFLAFLGAPYIYIYIYIYIYDISSLRVKVTDFATVLDISLCAVHSSFIVHGELDYRKV